MGFAVTFGRIDATALALYAGSIAWVIGYDTIYAHQDAEDDALIGIKSTARLFAPRTRPALAAFYGLPAPFFRLAPPRSRCPPPSPSRRPPSPPPPPSPTLPPHSR